jgi:hypothetical protein
VFRNGDRLFTVIASNRINTAGHPGMTVCLRDDYRRIVNITARPADDVEAVNFLLPRTCPAVFLRNRPASQPAVKEWWRRRFDPSSDCSQREQTSYRTR